MFWKGLIVFTLLINIALPAHVDFQAEVIELEVPWELIPSQENTIATPNYIPEEPDYYPEEGATDYRDYYDDYFDSYYYDEEPRDNSEYI